MKQVFNGIDRIEDAKRIFGRNRLGLLSAASGVSKNGDPTYAILHEKFNLCALYAPEHGIRSNLQEGIGMEDCKDDDTGLPLFNVFNPGAIDGEKLDKMLSGIDMLVYDIQDVGVRFYAYMYNLSDMMTRCAILKKPVVVLDRVNPIGGTLLEGPRLDEANFSSEIGRYNLPARYGMTIGEYAKWVNAQKNIHCELYVIELQGWERSLYADQTDLLFVNPSPNIPSVDVAINYNGTCLFEATNVSEGRGTTRPFNMIGAPYVNSKALVEHLRSKHIDGVTIRRAAFTPTHQKYAGQVCEGVELHITDRNTYRPLYTSLCIIEHMRTYKEFEIKPDRLAKLYGTNDINLGLSPETLIAKTEAELENYKKEIKPYLLY